MCFSLRKFFMQCYYKNVNIRRSFYTYRVILGSHKSFRESRLLGIKRSHTLSMEHARRKSGRNEIPHFICPSISRYVKVYFDTVLRKPLYVYVHCTIITHSTCTPPLNDKEAGEYSTDNFSWSGFLDPCLTNIHVTFGLPLIVRASMVREGCIVGSPD